MRFAGGSRSSVVCAFLCEHVHFECAWTNIPTHEFEVVESLLCHLITLRRSNVIIVCVCRCSPLSTRMTSAFPLARNWVAGMCFFRRTTSMAHSKVSITYKICRIVPRCLVTFWTHPEIIPVAQFFRRWIKSINQSSVDFDCKLFN